MQGILQGYTGPTRVYRVYKDIQGALEYTGYTRIYKVH